MTQGARVCVSEIPVDGPHKDIRCIPNHADESYRCSGERCGHSRVAENGEVETAEAVGCPSAVTSGKSAKSMSEK